MSKKRKVDNEGNHEDKDQRGKEEQEKEKQRTDAGAGRIAVPGHSWLVEPTGAVQTRVYPNAEAACQEALRYLEGSFWYDEPPTEVLWARMREGRRIRDESIRGLDGLQVQLMEVWEGLIREAKNDHDTEIRLIKDARGRLPVDMSCEFGVMSQMKENNTGSPCGAPDLRWAVSEHGMREQELTQVMSLQGKPEAIETDQSVGR
ncbi:hypothetical protein SK128_003236 [Halocaridina rubra]|uniref:Uncharacterized protein n=1 Tax=Halocaridina rubra TaxID=373956 RepID=A0AAN8WQM3_HALRR